MNTPRTHTNGAGRSFNTEREALPPGEAQDCATPNKEVGSSASDSTTTTSPVEQRWRDGEMEWMEWSFKPTNKPTTYNLAEITKESPLDPSARAENVWHREVSRTYYIKGKYWYLNDNHRWGEYTKDDLLTILKGTFLFRNRPPDARAATAWQREKHEAFTRRVLVGNQVEFVGELSGHFRGVSEFNNQKFLVKYGPKVIEPAQGDYPTIQGFLIDILGEEQLYYLRGWLRAAYTGLRDKDYSTGQMLILAGAKNVGKSFCKENIIRPILGGRHSDPSEYLKGNRFNSDVFESEAWEIDDGVGTAEKRKILTGAVKKVTASASHRIEGKNQNGVQPPPMFVRISAYVNDGPNDLFVIPELTESTRDKLILLHASRPQGNPLVKLPDANVEGERAAFKSKFRAELPAFLYSVLHDEIPNKYLQGRFGVAPYVHPVLEEALYKESDEGKLLEVIDKLVFAHLKQEIPWEGTTSELDLLLSQSAKFNNQTRDLERVKWKGDAIGSGLKQLSERPGSRVSKRPRRHGGARGWVIQPPSPGEEEDMTEHNGVTSRFR